MPHLKYRSRLNCEFYDCLTHNYMVLRSGLGSNKDDYLLEYKVCTCGNINQRHIKIETHLLLFRFKIKRIKCFG